MLLRGCLIALLAVGAAHAETHPFTIHDMLAMQRISDPQPSPDGSQVVFTLRTTDLEANRGKTDLWIVSTAGGEPRRLTSHDAGDFHPRWSPDGAGIYFLSTRSDSSQLWRIDLSGGEARPVTELPLDLSSFVVGADGEIVVSADTFADCPTMACTRERLDEQARKTTTGMIYDRLFVRHWDHWKDGRRSHLFRLTDEAPRDLMPGMDADCPTKPWGGAEEYTLTPDGKGVVFTARDVGREEPWSTDFDLWHVPLDGSAKPKKLTTENRAWDTTPAFSPDGKWLAYLAMERPGYESDRLRIMLRRWPDGKTTALTQDWDRSAGSILWSADGKTIYTKAADLGQRSIFAVDVKKGSVKKLIGEGTARSIGLAADRIVFGLDHLRSPTELYSAKTDGSSVRRITRINDARLKAARMGDAEQFTFKGWNNETVYAYLVKPVDFDATRKYPVAFLIHGGPQGSFGNDFHYRWNPQAYAGRGYASVMVDFHGSVGYGQAFTDSINSDWGGKPLEDLQKGLAAALDRYDFLDGDRVVALGASYGGYMINWIAGNWPDRFRALVNHDGNLDELTAYYMTEELWFPEWERGGPPWVNKKAYTDHSPIHHVHKWKTPMLVIHGALDYRVVDTQGLATFTALQRQGIPSKLLYFPDENHWVLQPQNSILWHDTVLDWIDEWSGREE